ncbi:unnamed protein product, partial [Mesorhabditis belari]|uniref:WW domain-containing protein n=1 Tax=Mesorhabditis belari TaxID=2138241 RepID=A0AAF3EV95_9BILA
MNESPPTFEKKKTKSGLPRELLAGWGAGSVETCLLYPANKIIFRQQLHGLKTGPAAAQLRSEGLQLLFRGLLPPLVMRSLSRALMFGLYDRFVSQCAPMKGILLTSPCHCAAAFLAGVCEAMLCPLERVQVLLQTKEFHHKFENTLAAFRYVQSKHGYREFWRGFSVIVARNGLSNIFFFGLRNPLKDIILQMNGGSVLDTGTPRVVAEFVSGAVLGTTISTFFFPFNVVKNRIQSQIGGPRQDGFSTLQLILKERMKPVKEVGDWSEQTSSSGKRYYYNRSTEVSQWEKPEEWKEYERKLEEYDRLQKRQQPMGYSNNTRPQQAAAATVSGSQMYQAGYLVPHPPPPPPPTSSLNLHTVTGHPYSNPYGPGPIAPQLSFSMNNVSQHIAASNNSSSPKAHPGQFHNSSNALNNRDGRDGNKDQRGEREKEQREKDIAGYRDRKRPYPRNSPREKDRENREFLQKDKERERENFRELNTNAHVPAYRNSTPAYQNETNDNPSSSSIFENKYPKTKIEEKPRYGDERATKFSRGLSDDQIVKQHVNGSAAKHAPPNDFDNRDIEGGSVPMDIEEERTESNVVATDHIKNFKKRFRPPFGPLKPKDPTLDDERLLIQEMSGEKKRLIENGQSMLRLYQTQALSQMCRVKAEVLNIRLRNNREVQKWIESRRRGDSIAVVSTSTAATTASAANVVSSAIAGLNSDLGLSNVMSSPLRLDNYS